MLLFNSSKTYHGTTARINYDETLTLLRTLSAPVSHESGNFPYPLQSSEARLFGSVHDVLRACLRLSSHANGSWDVSHLRESPSECLVYRPKGGVSRLEVPPLENL